MVFVAAAVQTLAVTAHLTNLYRPAPWPKIWSGIVEWKRHNRTKVSLLSCTVKALCSSPPDLKGHTWPDSLQLHLIPEETVRTVEEELLMKEKQRVLFKINPCIELGELCKALQHGLVGSVTFGPSPGCDIKLLTLWYYKNTKQFVGVIPKQQNEFISKLRVLMHNKLQQISTTKVVAEPPKANEDERLEMTRAWSGVIYWVRHDKPALENVSPLRCDVFTPTELLQKWPGSMTLHLMSKSVIERIIGVPLQESNFRPTVIFQFAACTELCELANTMRTGQYGLLSFDATSELMVVRYSDKMTYGFLELFFFHHYG